MVDDAAVSRTTKPLHIAASVLVIAKHRQIAISVVDARETIQRLAATRSPRPPDKELIEDLVGATGLEMEELAEVTKGWLPW
jgi:hypothetical protein